MEAQQFVAYYRVSTDRQGRSGLGLEAQQAAVSGFVGHGGNLVAQFTEVESGRKNDRPQLAAALAICKQRKARLVIAKLDRLARNVAFIANLMESGVEFIAVDMPEANRLTLHILAAVAEHEREAISKRTKEALQAAKVRGRQLGNPSPARSLGKGRMTAQDRLSKYRDNVRPIIDQLRSEGLGLRAMARELNQRGLLTVRGRSWQATSVRNML
jgi:DNA invertase Pin-like site-specific DNA recombinase